ncbi:MAG: ABC transporter permease, partial [Candidatus Acidiferrales bacterium]
MSQTASFLESAAVAVDSLRSSKMRSFLTLFGIILATTTLIAVMSVIHGMDVYIAQNVTSMGADGFRVVRMAFIGNFNPKKFLELQKKNPELREDEFQFLKDHVTLVREMGMQESTQAKVAYGNQSLTQVDLDGGTANYGVLANIEIASGRFISDAEDRLAQPVCVIGNDIKVRFFPNVDPIGKTIRVDGRPFTVVGVAKAKGSVFGNSQDN